VRSGELEVGSWKWEVGSGKLEVRKLKKDHTKIIYMPKILVIDDERSIRSTLQEILEYEKHEVSLASSGPEGLEIFNADKFDIVLCDIKMPEMDGMEVLDKLMESSSDVPVVMISGHGNIDTAVAAIKKGAYDFIEKPLDLNRLLITVRNALDKSTLITETKILRKKISKSNDMIGSSSSMAAVKDMIEKVAPTEARVLITGDNGTGKELVAKWLHEKSERSSMPFIEVNCAAIPSELIESELFGHEKGAFTSAIKQRKGKFEQADGGTLFLDEIGDMSLSAQAKVLRALQENKISRVGNDKDISVNVRIIAATNKNLREEIEKNNFREDLYHRLSVILIHVPSLNDRKDDIPELANHFNELICSEYGMPVKIIKDEAIAELKKINWTGNIREFRNVLERLIILCDKEITGKDIIQFAKPISNNT
jgi:two-component system nitrogen regulation response regulator NtrX